MAKQPKHIIHDNAVYELSESELFSNYKKLAVPVQEPHVKWLGPKIPWALWTEMVAWCQVTQEKFQSEALVFLFLDLQTKTWRHWCPPQITQGMTVKADEDHPEYKIQRRQFPDLQFGSLHHHCTAKAFASGTDHADEVDREGLHFTIGDLGSKEHSVHFRFCIQGTCHELPAHTVIEMSPEVEALPEKYRYRIHSEAIKDPVQADLWDFTEALKNVEKKTFSNISQFTTAGGKTKIGGGINTHNKPTLTEFYFNDTMLGILLRRIKEDQNNYLELQYTLAELLDDYYPQGSGNYRQLKKAVFITAKNCMSATLKSRSAKAKQDEFITDVCWYSLSQFYTVPTEWETAFPEKAVEFVKKLLEKLSKYP